MRKVPRLLYGFLSSSLDATGIKYPWQPSDKDGLFKMNYSSILSERDNLILWAHTNKGERPMDFEFGLDVRRCLFMPVPEAKDNLINNAKIQLDKYFPYLKIEQINILSFDEDISISENSLRVILKVRTKEGQLIEIDEVIN